MAHVLDWRDERGVWRVDGGKSGTAGSQKEPSVMVTAGEHSDASVFRVVVLIAAACIILTTTRMAADFLTPVLIGFWIALLCLPIVAKLRALGLPNWAAVFTPVLTLTGTFVVLAWFAVAWLADLIDDLPTYQAQISAKRADLNAWLGDRGIHVPASDVSRHINLDQLVNLVEAVLPGTVNALAGVVFVLLILTYALFESSAAKRRLVHALGPDNPNLGRLREFVRIVGQAMVARAILGLAAAVGDGILLIVLGVPQVGLWVIVSFICSFIPYLGY